MAQTTRQLITGALRLINVIQTNETPADDDMDIALSAFDQMIDSWSNERLMVYTIKAYIFNTIGGQKDYLLGPGSPILTFGMIVGGSGYANGTYSNVPLTTLTGSGQGASATVTIAGGQVTTIDISINQAGGGFGYKVGDQIGVSVNDLGGVGAGFTALVASIGPGDWNIVRPLRIEQCAVIWNDPLSAQAVDIPIQLVNDAQYASLAVKNTPSTFPFVLYDNGAYPVKTCTVWPVPTTASGIRLWLRQPLVDFDDLDTIVSYPPGYERAFRFNLAVEIAPEFSKTISSEVAATAVASKQDIATVNAVPQYMSGDGGLSGKRSTFNWITGDLIPFGPR